MIRVLKNYSKKDSLYAGGKGANLGELIKCGMPVPPGFVITGKSSDQKIIKAYKELGGGPVAVRSSATVEDSPDSAFAGQFETRLNVVGEKSLLKAIQEVKNSLRSDRVISYCKLHRIDIQKIRLGVIVQKMIDPDFAGILFTANPITGDQRETLIDSNPGLGEAVVSGMVTPEHFLMRKRFWGWQLVEHTEGDQRLVIKPKKGGGTKKFNQSNQGNISKGAVKRLAQWGEKIERHLKAPQDIEWALVGDEIFILQSRPITTLPEVRLTRMNRVMNALIAGIIPERPLPLEASTLGIEQIYKKLLYPLMSKVGFKVYPFKQLFKKEDGVLVSFSGQSIARPSIRILLVPFKLFKPILFYRVSEWKQDPLVTQTLSSIDKLEKENLTKKTPKELIEHAQKTINVLNPIMDIRLKYMPRLAAVSAALYFILLVRGRKKEFTDYLFSELSTKVTETNEHLKILTEKISGNKILKTIFIKNKVGEIRSQLKKTKEGQKFWEEFSEFLEKYGYRESKGTLSISNPTWKESPELVLGILKGASSSTPPPKPKKKKLKPLFFKKILGEARHLQELREDTRFYIMMLIPTLRDVLLRFGKNLVKAEVIKKPADVFYFKFSELKKAARTFPLDAKTRKKLKELYQRRKSKILELEAVPFIDPKLYRSARRKGDSFLVGTSGSPGEVEGQARVIKEMSEFKNLRPGEILIAPYTNPAWTPLFENAAGVVVDTGGVMSHAAIVAREYGIPAVMGTSDGTQKIKTGDKISVNGTSGEVFKLN